MLISKVERERRETPSIYWFPFPMPATTGLAQAKPRKLGLPLGYQRPVHSSHYLLKACIREKLDEKQTLD